jgi:copper chaperone
MKSVIKVCNMNSPEDVNEIRMAISDNEGIIACHINSEKGEINVVYNDKFIRLDEIIQSIEEAGYVTL